MLLYYFFTCIPWLNRLEISFILITQCIWVQIYFFGGFKAVESSENTNLDKVKCSWFECLHCKCAYDWVPLTNNSQYKEKKLNYLSSICALLLHRNNLAGPSTTFASPLQFRIKACSPWWIVLNLQQQHILKQFVSDFLGLVNHKKFLKVSSLLQ